MKKVVVTGASGKAGKATVTELVEHGYEVTAVDIVKSEAAAGVSAVVADVTDAGETIDVMRGHDAVVHMAAIPAPRMLPDPKTFAINVTSTYNVFWAAEVLGMSRVVWASSETVLGLPLDSSKLSSAPLDESSELFPETAYSLSKLCGEAMAAQIARRTGMTIIGLRFSNIMLHGRYASFDSWQDDPTKRQWNLWGYVDVRDVGQSCRVAVEADVEGAENFIIAAADTVMRTGSAELMASTFPGCEIKPLADPRQTLLSIEKARRVLGYQPQYSWIDEVSGSNSL